MSICSLLYSCAESIIAAESKKLIRDAVSRIEVADFVCDDDTRIELADSERKCGVELYEHGDIEDSIVHFNLSLALSPSDHRTYANRSLALMKLGKSECAIKDASAAVRLLPQWPKVHPHSLCLSCC